MTEQNMSFKVVMLAKEKGFVPYCQTSNRAFRFYTNQTIHGVDNRVYYQLMCEIQKWLIDEYQIILFVSHETIDDAESAFTWTIKVYVPEGVEGTRKKKEYDFWKWKSSLNNEMMWWKTYEEALEEGLLKALKLIK